VLFCFHLFLFYYYYYFNSGQCYTWIYIYWNTKSTFELDVAWLLYTLPSYY